MEISLRVTRCQWVRKYYIGNEITKKGARHPIEVFTLLTPDFSPVRCRRG